MPRTLSTNTLAALYRATAPHIVIEQRFSVENYAGTMVDLSNFLGKDWCIEGHTIDQVDTPVTQATFVLAREYKDIATTLSPYMSASPANVWGGVYRQLLKESRRITWDVRMVVFGTAPVVGDWLPMFDGKIDEIDGKGRGNTITISARDKFAWLLDTQIDLKRTYCAAGPLDARVVMAQILADNPQSKLGAVSIVDALPTGPTPPAFGLWMMRKFDQDQVPVLTALRDIAFQFGGEVRGMWQADNTYRLTVFQPDRAKTAVDWTLSPDDYFDVPTFKVGDADVRNKGICRFINSATGLLDFRVASNGASITEHGDRFMEFDEDATSNIDTPAEADAFLGYALSDLAFPVADVAKETRLFPLGTLYDLGAFPANGVHYDTTQNFGIVEVRHDVTPTTRRSTMRVKGRVAGSAFQAITKGANASRGLLLNAPSLTYAFVGLTVVITATPPPGSAGVLFASALNTQVTDADIVAGTLVSAPPYELVLPAPPAASVLSVGAMATNGIITSAATRLVIPGRVKPTMAAIPVVLNDTGATTSPLGAGGDGDLGLAQISFDASPYLDARLSGEIGTVAPGAYLEMMRWDAATSAWVGVATPAVRLDLDVAGPVRGDPQPIALVGEDWFAVFVWGMSGTPFTLKSLALNFIPASYSMPPVVCNSSLSGLEDWGEDWCGYVDDAAALAAYRWVLQPDTGFGTWWSDYNEPVDDVEGMDVGLYDNIHMPFAPDYKRDHIVRGLPYLGGSTALDFDSAVIIAEMGGTVHETQITDYRGMRNNVPVNVLGGSMPQAKVTVLARVWIDGASDLSTGGNFVEPCYVGWTSFGAFGECRAVIAPDTPGGTPHLYLVVYSYNSANTYEYDCGPAGSLIGDPVGHLFKLQAQIIPASDSAYDKMEAVLQVSPLTGSASTFAGTWTIRNQNLLNGGGFWVGDLTWFWCNRNGAGYVHARCYSVEYWFGDKVWLGPNPPAIATSDVTPPPDDDSTVATSLAVTDEFVPRAPGRPGLPVPTVALPAPWARFNDGGLISGFEKSGAGAAVLTLAGDGSNTPRGGELTVPQLITDHDYNLLVSSAAATGANSGVLIWMRESATGKWVAFGIHDNGTNRRMSVWTGAGGQIFRGATDITETAGTLHIERSAGQWYFHHQFTGGLVTDHNVSVASLFTSGPDRVGFGGWSGAGGAVLTFDALRFS